jgi:hypothetical protein
MAGPGSNAKTERLAMTDGRRELILRQAQDDGLFFKKSPAEAKTRRSAYLLHTVLPGAVLAGALVFAPWFWGCTWPLGIRLLTIFLFGGISAWAAGILLRRRKLNLPMVLVWAVLGLLAQGWLMALNGRTICDEDSGLLLPVAGHCAWLPGSTDQERSREDMLRLSGLLGAGIISAWLGQDRNWRRAILWTLVMTGMSIALLGCVQRLTGAHDIFWNETRRLDFFFGTYRNVTNAGEYFNFVLPLAAALAVFTARAGGRPGQLALAVMAGAILVAGSCVSGSKMAPLATGAGLAIFLVMNRGEVRRRGSWMGTGARLAIVAVVVAVIVQSVGLGTTWNRWERVIHDQNGGATFSHRLAVDQVCALALPDAGAWGFGPGTFRAMFPYYSGGVAADLTGVWTYAHDDYAQTAVEWGWAGGALWAVYFFGGLVVLAQGWRRAGWKMEDRIYGSGLLAALGMIAAMAAVDFPLQIASIQLGVNVVLGLAWSSRSWPRLQLPG